MNVVPPTAVEAYVVKVWGETRLLPGSTVAQVEAYVVPASGVGWVDCEWRALTVPNSRRHVKMSSEHRRLLADWTGGDQSSIVRQVIQVADEWFTYCAELAEREVAAAALAADPDKTFLPVGLAGVTGLGPPPPIQSPRNMQEMQRPIEEMQKACAVAGAGAAVDRFDVIDADIGGTTLKIPCFAAYAPSPSPQPREDAIQGVLVPFAGEAVFGTPESASDGLSDLPDYISEPHVGR